MKLIITDFEDFSEVVVMDGETKKACFTFDDERQARSFCQGFSCARNIANSLIQSMPSSYERQEK